MISRPDWSEGIADAEHSGGPAIDLHIHDTHYIGLLAGIPSAVESRGLVQDGAVVHLATQYLYEQREPPVVVTAVSGALSQAGRSFTHGFDLYLQGATLSYDFANLMGRGHVATPLSVILPDGTVQHPEVGASDPIDAFAAELTLAIEAVGTGIAPAPLSGELARQALEICWSEVESVKRKTPIAIGGTTGE